VPLWNVHEALGHPGRILVQVAEMPDGVRYLCVGRSTSNLGNFLRRTASTRSASGVKVAHAEKVGLLGGLNLDARPCPVGGQLPHLRRPDCHQRAFPPLVAN